MGHSPPDSPSSSARSPLMFTPQIPMVPIPKGDEFSLGAYSAHGGGMDPLDMGGAQEQEQGVPTMIAWTHGGDNVSVEGSWDNWTTRLPLQLSGKDFTILKVLPAGMYQYKFIVDEVWRFAPDLPAIYDEIGNVNNVLEVQAPPAITVEQLGCTWACHLSASADMRFQGRMWRLLPSSL
eukprot:jgi/Mesen1/8512/ME000480S07867